ncbi:MAG: protein pufQ [Rhodobacteraceae bacterium]|nr:protein pufQ [Paracoccaceae bacterium]TVR43660.1 MAG: protein pufQ [Paracoccaceae bacterium]
MADYTVNAPRPRHERPRNWEYGLYFSVIFVLALATGLVTWTWRLVSTGKLPALGPVGRALADANVIAPIIFRS